MSSDFEKTVCALGLRFFPGKQAITESAKNRITAKNTKNLGGSVRLDEDLKSRYPNDNRWDYVVAYNSGNKTSLFFIEVHPACGTSKAKEVVAKKEWLDNWLAAEGQDLIHDSSKVAYCWVATNRISPLDSPARKIIAKRRIIGPLKELVIRDL